MATASTIPVKQAIPNWFPSIDAVQVSSAQAKDAVVYTSVRAKFIESKIVAPTVRQFVAFMVGGVPEVECVLTSCDHENRILRVFSVIDPFDAGIRDKIYAKEEKIIDEFEMFNFEFNIISRRGKPLKDCITDPGLELTFQRRA